jgi:hypothetical protein
MKKLFRKFNQIFKKNKTNTVLEKQKDVKLEWDIIDKRCNEFLEILRGITWENRLKIFRLYENNGYHITESGFYSPIPTISELSDNDYKSSKWHVQMNEKNQMSFLERVSKHKPQYDKLIHEGRYPQNNTFTLSDPMVYFSIIHEFKPKKIIEIGSGNSTRLSYLASEFSNTEITSIDPYVKTDLEKELGKKINFIKKPVQAMEPSYFKNLSENDILFIDSSHVSKIGSDVNYLFLQILPILNPGVLIHIHDIYYPWNYSRLFTEEHLIFWNEQYMLGALLTGNVNFEVLLAVNFLSINFKEQIKKILKDNDFGGGSFWMKKGK